MTKNGFQGEWEQKFSLVGAKNFTIKHIELSYFDIVKKERVMLRSERFDVSVKEAYTKEELSTLKNEGYFTEIGQQIIVASHTALEIYLILKFKEYYRYSFSSSDPVLVEESLNQFSFRSLKDFNELYKKFVTTQRKIN